LKFVLKYNAFEKQEVKNQFMNYIKRKKCPIKQNGPDGPTSQPEA
jgi:hypothetical protein